MVREPHRPTGLYLSSTGIIDVCHCARVSPQILGLNSELHLSREALTHYAVSTAPLICFCKACFAGDGSQGLPQAWPSTPLSDSFSFVCVYITHLFPHSSLFTMESQRLNHRFPEFPVPQHERMCHGSLAFSVRLFFKPCIMPWFICFASLFVLFCLGKQM